VPTGCSPRHRGCWPAHQQLVEDYRAARLAAELALDVAYGGTREELATARSGVVTFHRWLVQTTGCYRWREPLATR